MKSYLLAEASAIQAACGYGRKLQFIHNKFPG
jgi:hypothetical protein